MANTLISDFLSQCPFLFGGGDQEIFANGITGHGANTQPGAPTDLSYEQEMKLALQDVLGTEDIDWGELGSIDCEADSEDEGRELAPSLSGIAAPAVGTPTLLYGVEPHTLLAALNAFISNTDSSIADAPVSPRSNTPIQAAVRLVPSGQDWPAIPETAAFALSLQISTGQSRAAGEHLSAFSARLQDLLPAVQRIVTALEGTTIEVTSVKAAPVLAVRAEGEVGQSLEFIEAPGVAREAALPVNEISLDSEVEMSAPGSVEIGRRNDEQQALQDLGGATEDQADNKNDRNENAGREAEPTNNHLLTNELMPGVDVLPGAKNTASAARPGEAPRSSLSTAASEQIQALRQEATQRNPISHLVLELEGAGEGPVRLRLMNTSGQVRLEVHSPEAEVRHVLRSDLGDLMSRIERAGFQVAQSPGVPVARVTPPDPSVALPPRWVDPVAGPVVDTRATGKSEHGQMRNPGRGRERRGSGDPGVKR